MGSLGSLPVTMLIMAIGMSLGGTTGYAINPARDLPPRVAHSILPIREGHERVGLQLGTRNGARTGRTRRRADLRMRLYVRLTAAAPYLPWPLLTGERLFRIRQEAGRGGRKRIIIINRYRAGHDRDGNRFPG